ncbi:hypothetical protein [Catellatospora paridis]|uniref:hypothetical protein n=1 Tax=Catellatospora paridis TaxID=1617086 RepID=UPI0012D47B39|nr:hypothetical protein [Catellatospora paridis]
MSDDKGDRFGRIAAKLAAARATPELSRAFGVAAHKLVLRPPLPEAAVADFEDRHEVTLPSAYRSFITELGDGGAGPGTGLNRLADMCGTTCTRPGHLAQASPYLPGPRYVDDWEQRHEDPPGPDRDFLRGTLKVTGHGCSLVTRLVVTGPARGRLINLDCDGPVGPYVVEDADFLAWYERWLDEVVAGYDTGWFGERLPLEEPDLLAVLADDLSPERRRRAGRSLLDLPAVSEVALTAIGQAVAMDPDPTTRAALLYELTWQRHDLRHRPDSAEAAADEVAKYARSCDPPGLAALAELRKLTFDDIRPELASDDLERARNAAYVLGSDFAWSGDEKAAKKLLDQAARRLLGDPDPLLRFHGVVIVSRFGLAHLHPVLREIRQSESDPWVLYYINGCVAEKTRSTGYTPDPWDAESPR